MFSVSVDYAICGLAPLGEYLVILLYDEQPTEDVNTVFIVCKIIVWVGVLDK